MILFISLSAEQNNPETDWAASADEGLLRQCPKCCSDSIIGHGRRLKQAHDETHDWIRIRRGICKLCGKTFTFLPSFSPPYGHYSRIAHSQALWGYFVENRSLEMAAPVVKDPDRIPAPSTLRRWFRRLDSSVNWQHLEQLQPDAKSAPLAHVPIAIRQRTPFPWLQKTLEVVRQRLAAGEIFRHGPLVLSWRTLALFLHIRLPLRS